MSRQLERLKNMVVEIEEIQTQGRLRGQVKVQEKQASEQTPERAPERAPETSRVEPAAPVIPLLAEVPFIKSQDTHPQWSNAQGSQVSLELSANVSVKLKLENSDERIEVKQIGDQISVEFKDGKTIRIPLKAV